MKSSDSSRKRFGAGLEQMARYWKADSAILVEELRTALTLGDWNRLLEGAHRLAGGAGVMGALEVAERARALEMLARRRMAQYAPPDSEATRLLSRLERACERFLNTLARELVS